MLILDPKDKKMWYLIFHPWTSYAEVLEVESEIGMFSLFLEFFEQ